MKKLFCFDLDGTLLNSDKKVNKSSIKALKKAHKKGNLICIATGRSFDENLLKIAKKIKCNTYIIFSNGNFMYNMKTKEIKCTGKVLLPAIVDFFYEKALINKRQLVLVNDKTEVKRFYFGSQEEFDIKDEDYFLAGVNVSSFEDRSGVRFALNENIVHISMKAEKKIVNYELPKFKLIEEIHDVDINLTSKVFIDGDGRDVNKWTAIKRIIKEFDVDFENVYAFGDSFNDYVMLINAKNSFCMENAGEDFKAFFKNKIIENNNTDSISEIIIDAIQG